MLESLVVAALLALAGCAVMTWLARPWGRASLPAGESGDDGRVRPATVNLVLTKCSPGAAAYQATILDLAARGFLAASSQPGHLWLTPAQPVAGLLVLAVYEQQVLGDMRARLADTGGAPFMALADACAADVRGTWQPFEEKLLADSRQRGICRPLLPATGRNVLLALAATAVIAAVAFVVGRPHPAGAADGPVFTPLIAVIAFWCGLGWLERQDRLTAAGSALAIRWKREKADLAAAAAWEDASPAALERRAFAVAAGIRRAAPGPPPLAARHPGAGRPRKGRRVRAGPPSPTGRPADAWSSFSGTWRLVPTGPGEGMGMGAGVAMLGVAAWLGIIAYAISIPGGTGPLPLALGAVAAGVGALGLRRLLRLSALPATATFDGQVIARWEEEDNDSENGSGQRQPHILVDDGQRGWTFSGSAVFDRAALGDLVRVTVNPRSRKLLDLTVTDRPRAAAGPAEPGTPRPGPLLTVAEAAGLLGPDVRVMAVPSPGGRGVFYKGSAGTLSVMVLTGRIADINLGSARKRGMPLPGIGDEAWLVNRDRTVVARVGAETAKLLLSGRAGDQNPDLLPQLAATVAARLAAQTSRNV